MGSRTRSAAEAAIRDFEERDRDACLAVFDSNVPRHFLLEERAAFEEFLASLPGPYFVLELAEGRVAGCGGYALADSGRRADLCWGMVRAELHGEGLGRRLTRHRIAEAAAHPGVREIVLQTSQLTTGFYGSLGFELSSVERDGFGPGLDNCEMVLAVGEGGP